jgi:hypothetical protein
MVRQGHKAALQLREPADDNGADYRFLITVMPGWGFWMVSVHGGRSVAVGVGGGGKDKDGGLGVGVNWNRGRAQEESVVVDKVERGGQWQ